ncbi:MAG: sensor histidine kinase [Fibrobacter sp.]|nr:sensor histidine kinase [Fibrobacter sp.]MBR6122468.1 sensor histidine kinase [Candidatus Saccharibacteria bacterium]
MEIGINEAIQHFFSTTSFNMVYSEALANALDAGANDVSIDISIESYSKPETLEIRIRDNGEGFTDKNFAKFSELLKKSDKSHKGLGRLVYLKYFRKVDIESVFETNSKRTFSFHEHFKSKSQNEILPSETESYSLLTFKDFSNTKLLSYDNIKASDVKEYLLDQFLPSFFLFKKAGKDFRVLIRTSVVESNKEKDFYSDCQEITIADLPLLNERKIDDVNIDFFKQSLDLFYAIDDSYQGKITTAICIDGRAMEIPLLKSAKIPEKISGVFLLSSSFFDSKSDDSRQNFNFKNDELKVIEKVFSESISEILNERFPEIKTRNTEISNKLTERYPHLDGYFEKKAVCLLDENKILEEAQNKFFKEQKAILDAAELNDDLYDKSLRHATRVLTEYVLYRNKIIDKLRNITGEEKEAKIHNLIAPMQNTFSAESFINDLYSNNAWLLDDKYMSYRSILSDENIEKLISSISEDPELRSNDLKPDIALVFSNDIETTKHPVDVVVVELKKKGLGYLDNTRVLDQLEQRARRLLGLYPNKIQRMWFFGIVEFDKELKIKMREGWTQIYSEGEAYYKSAPIQPIDKDKNPIGDKTYPVSMTLMSFDALWKDAKTRNETFLRILRESIKKYVSETTS